MAGSVNIPPVCNSDPVRRIPLVWTSDAATGAVSGTYTGIISGVVLRVVIIPNSGGTQPDNLYDVTLLDEGGVDILSGLGANLTNTTTYDKIPGVVHTDGTTTSTAPRAISDKLELRVANAGNSKGGQVVLYVR
jgi:hypothetical protein